MKYILFLLDNVKLRLHAVFLTFLILLHSLLEVFGLYAALQLFEISSPFVAYFLSFGFSIETLGLLVLSVLFIAGALRLLISFYSSLFAQNFRLLLTSRFTRYLKVSDLDDFVKYGRSNVQKDLIQEIDNLISNFVQPLLLAVGPVILSLVYFVFGLYVLGKIFLIFSISILAFYCVYFFFIRATLVKLGADHLVVNEARNREILAILNDMRSFRLGGVNETQLLSSLTTLSLLNSRVFLLIQIPKVFLDFIVFGLIIGALIYSSVFGVYSSEDLLLVLIVLARLMPPIQSVYSTVSSLKYGMPSMRHLMETYSANSWRSDLCNLTYVKELSYTSESISLHLTDRDFSSHGIYRIFGPSGSGKSTLIDLLIGMRSPHSFTGKKAFKKTVALSSDTYIPAQSVLQFFGKDIYDFTKQEMALYQLLELDEVVKTSFSDFVIASSADNISNGQRQRLLLFRAYLSNPEVLVLDEATSGFSVAIEARLLDFLNSLEIVVFFISHRNVDFAFKETVTL